MVAATPPFELQADPKICIAGGDLIVHGRKILGDVPSNVSVCAPAGVEGVYIGFTAAEPKSRHVFSIGKLRGLRFMACFRFKLWWMTQAMGSSGKQLPLETQFLLVESEVDKANVGADVGEVMYTVFLPQLDGAFRASLQGNLDDEVEICLESGCPSVKVDQSVKALFVNSGPDPYKVIADAVESLELLSQSFVSRKNKKMPGMLDYFGWCTWDAFYTDVNAEGVDSGLTSLAKGGTPAKFLIIDDGWQSVAADEGLDVDGAVITQGTQYASRLVDLKENQKFLRNSKRRRTAPEEASGMEAILGLGDVVRDAKELHDVKYIYVWHALMGYWGGIKPDLFGRYETALAYPVHTPGVLGNAPDMAMDSLTTNGLGVVHPSRIHDFYNDMHAYLASAGIDGVKVDSQNILETLGAGHGGRVAIAKQYHAALEASIGRNFPDNGIIACMSHNTDGLYSSKHTAVVRASDDFWPRDPASHTVHIASVVYNSLFLGEFMQPDWDMFHSLHPAAEYHAAARACGGCAVYVSDKPDMHDYELLKKLVLPDGGVLRARLPGRPTRDCLFTDPARDNKSMLKVWNMNACNGIVGAFNCQGAGWCKAGGKYLIHNAAPGAVTSIIKASDANDLSQVAEGDWDGDSVAYSHRGGELIRLVKGAALPLTLGVLEYELFTIAPIKVASQGLAFAPIGLVSMFNSGGAIDSIEYQDLVHAPCTPERHESKDQLCLELQALDASPPELGVDMLVRGSGNFVVYSTRKPRKCILDGSGVDMIYDSASCRVTMTLPVLEGSKFRSLRVEV
eukprot:SM000430S15905  [mRNA]  locus=s430:25035:31120:- [translate_table: standard]